MNRPARAMAGAAAMRSRVSRAAGSRRAASRVAASFRVGLSSAGISALRCASDASTRAEAGAIGGSSSDAAPVALPLVGSSLCGGGGFVRSVCDWLACGCGGAIAPSTAIPTCGSCGGARAQRHRQGQAQAPAPAPRRSTCRISCRQARRARAHDGSALDLPRLCEQRLPEVILEAAARRRRAQCSQDLGKRSVLHSFDLPRSYPESVPGCSRSSRSAAPSNSRSCSLPRLRRERMVPTGTPSMAAISS